MSRRIVRFSLDLEVEQRNFVRLFALKNGINASVVMRAMIYRLETDPLFANQVIDLIFSVPEEEVTDDDWVEGAHSPEVEIPAAAESEPADPPPPAKEPVEIKLSEIQPGDHVYDSEGNKILIK